MPPGYLQGIPVIPPNFIMGMGKGNGEGSTLPRGLEGGDAEEFGAGAAHLLQKAFACMELCVGDAGCEVAGVHVALPVGAYYDAALAEHHPAGEERVRPCRVDLHQQQGGAPPQDGMAGRVRSAPGQTRLRRWRQRSLVKKDERPCAHIILLGVGADAVAGGGSFLKDLIDFRGAFL